MKRKKDGYEKDQKINILFLIFCNYLQNQLVFNVCFCDLDEQAPRFRDACPRYLQVYAGSGSTEAVVNYDVPEATDNAGADQVVVEK